MCSFHCVGIVLGYLGVCFGECEFVWALAFFLGVPATVKKVESQSSPPKKTFSASSGAVQVE